MIDMEELILSRIDYMLLAIFVIVLVLVVVLVIGGPSSNQEKKQLSATLVKSKQKIVQHLPEYIFLAALLGLFVIITIASYNHKSLANQAL